MKRTIQIDATCSFAYEIDDEAISDWDGATILTVLERRGRGNEIYTADATLENLLGWLGIQLSVENRRMGNIDGWADFPAEAADGRPYSVEWEIEDVTIGPRQTSDNGTPPGPTATHDQHHGHTAADTESEDA